MNQLIAIVLGGSAGALTRFFVANGIYAWLGRSFPYGTLFINVSGSFLMGFLTVMLTQRFAAIIEYRAGLLIGFLGAYTTFSTFAIESFYLFEAGNWLKGSLNVVLSNLFCLAAVWIGMLIGRKLFNTESANWQENLPYISMALGVIAAIALTAGAEFLMQTLALSHEWRLVMQTLLLAVLTVTTTLWVSFKLFSLQVEQPSLLAVFISANLGSLLIIGLGSLLGNWLWQLNLLR